MNPFLLFVLVMIISFSLTCVSTLVSNYKYYKTSYNKLVNGDFIFNYTFGKLYYFIPKEIETGVFYMGDEKGLLIKAPLSN